MLNSSVVRCVNLDWLEVHAREPVGVPHDRWYFEEHGFSVKVRDYGTRVYKEMFTLMQTNDEPLLEVRRNPASVGVLGIHSPEECHIRLCNRTCYFDNAAAFLRDFLTRHGYTDVRIFRADICLDFVKFDRGDAPDAFVRRYFQHKYAKINQGRITGHGDDTWTGQEWNSLSWGAKTSQVTTKLYNKTLELYDMKFDRFKKPYIREAWFKCGMIDDIQRVTKDGERVDVWRVEFSLRSSVKNWLKIEIDGKAKNYQSIKNTLDVYDGRDKLLVMFASLAQHYFHFKIYEAGQRKDRCADKVLFMFNDTENVYKIGRPNVVLGSGETFKSRYHRLIEKIREYQLTHKGVDIQKACDVLIKSISDEDMRSDLSDPWDKQELLIIKKLIEIRSEHREWTYDVAMEEVKRQLNITDRTLPKKAVQ